MQQQDGPPAAGSALEVLRVFTRLGLTSFGGPVAHVGYFRAELVERRGWLDEHTFAQLLALCQFLPGPASSQLGFAIGLVRAGWAGALAAFLAFTTPSVVALLVLAMLLPGEPGTLTSGALHGLKLVALCVVAQGVLGMSRQLCPDPPRATIAALTAAGVLLAGSAWAQIVAVVLGGVAGARWLGAIEPVRGTPLRLPHGAGLGRVLLVAFAVLLVGLPMLAATDGGATVAVVDAFYRAGALVFGGGHVVLPLLEEAVVAPGWVSADDFLAGYGAAQAVPGPMFTLAAFLGARLDGGAGGIGGALLATGAIFLPGFLLLAGALPLWSALASRPGAARAVAGVNAAVVGLLGAALYDPVWTSAVRGPVDVAIALAGLVALTAWRAPALAVVAWCLAASAVAAVL
ncbi:MAG: chromate efflux transporter [Ectothiorhodospiraceae bacterium]|nr:chromate efflux transporter [Ectothiorhodospiraceae bacterium]